MNLLKAVSPVVVFCSMSVFSDVIDDLEDGNNQNETGYYWYYYTDAADGGTSEITNATKDDAGKLIMTPTAGKGHYSGGADGGYAAECSWKFGANKPAGCSGECDYGQMVGMGTMLCADGEVTGAWAATATTIKFWAKASVPFKLTVEIATKAVGDFGYHMKNVQVTTAWAQYSISLADITQPSWAVESKLDPADMQKIQFKISADNAGTPNIGSLYIDDVEIDCKHPETCGGDAFLVSAGQTIKGTLIADFEGEKDLIASKIKGRYWYVYSDSKSTATTKSSFTSGTKPNEEDGTDQLVIEAGNTNGYDSSQGLSIGFKLGESYLQGADVVSPFVGIGCMFSNSDKYAAGTVTSVEYPDLTNATGIYFEYKTDVINERFKGISVEFYDADTLPDGMSFSMKLPPTSGVWKGVKIPFDSLKLPDWPDKVKLLTAAQKTLDKNKLDKMQIQIQSVAGVTGKVSFDNFIFADNITSVKYKPAHNSGIAVISKMTANGLIVTLPAGLHTGVIELVGVNGRAVAKENVSATNVFTLNTSKLAAGMYILKVNTVSGNKTCSVSNKISILN